METADQWDARLREHGGHLLQSWAWGEFKHGHGWVPERVLIDNGHGVAMASLLFRRKGPVSIGYIPRGPVICGDRGALWSELLPAMDRIARRQRAISIVIEPEASGEAGKLGDAGGVADVPDHIQPARTVKVPLLDDEPLLAQMHAKTRYNVRLAPRRGVRFCQMPPTRENIGQFHTLMQETAQRNAFGIHPAGYYDDVLRQLGDDAALIGAWSVEGHLAAALIVAAFGNEAIYLYGASSTRHRAHGAGVAIQFEAMKWARARGCAVYDLWGIPAHDPEPPTDRNPATRGRDWSGLYRFKTGFGGDIVSYPDALERRYLPVLPWLARRFGCIHG